MDRIQELIQALSDEAVIGRAWVARQNRTCKICGQLAIRFRSSAFELEYRLSSICQACQDYYLACEP